MTEAAEPKIPWQFTADRASTRLITPGQRKKVVAWLETNGATPPESTPGPRYERFGEKTEPWTLKEGELVIIHDRPDFRNNKMNIRLDSSVELNARLIQEGVLPSPKVKK